MLEQTSQAYQSSSLNGTSQSQSDSSAKSGTSASGYDAQLAQLSPTGGESIKGMQELNQALNLVAAGQHASAQAALSGIADKGRATGDTPTVEVAGLMWQISNRMSSTKKALASKNFNEAMSSASAAADLMRTVQVRGVDANASQAIIETAGGFYTAAKEALENMPKSDVPIVDQHRLPHERNWAFCGIATMIMVLRKNGHEASSANRTDVQRLAQGIYYKGQGTSGAGMAARLRDHGLEDAQYTTGGSLSHVITTLQSGQPVPFGVLSSEGTITELGSGGSKRYPHYKVGSKHYKAFDPNSGPWVLVTGFEGTPENPSSFTVNDPDLGGKLRVTPAQLESMGAANAAGGGMWMVHQAGK